MLELTVETIDQVIDVATRPGATEIDLRDVGFIDPYALLLLVLTLRQRRDRVAPLAVRWPGRPSVLRWLKAMGLTGEIGGSAADRPPDSHVPGAALQPITPIACEARVSDLAAAFDRRLSERYPLTATSRNVLTKIMLELFQNIPQHGDATGGIGDVHGIAAMQDYRDAIFLAVADCGVGLRASLSTRSDLAVPSDRCALDAIVFEGLSRFVDPGRGGELRRIARLVRNWDGLLALRSGSAVLIMNAERGEIHDAPPFPGVQIALRLPRRVFGIDEAPVDNPSFSEFNELHG